MQDPSCDTQPSPPCPLHQSLKPGKQLVTDPQASLQTYSAHVPGGRAQEPAFSVNAALSTCRLIGGLVSENNLVERRWLLRTCFQVREEKE